MDEFFLLAKNNVHSSKLEPYGPKILQYFTNSSIVIARMYCQNIPWEKSHCLLAKNRSKNPFGLNMINPHDSIQFILVIFLFNTKFCIQNNKILQSIFKFLISKLNFDIWKRFFFCLLAKLTN